MAGSGTVNVPQLGHRGGIGSGSGFWQKEHEGIRRLRKARRCAGSIGDKVVAMPRIDEETVGAVARLARLALTPDELARYARELEAIVAWADSLQALDTTGVPPLKLDAGSEALREDEPKGSLPRDVALEAAPDTAEGLFRVPRVLP
jgi:aspartyl-tRNA(Asn)/glutamyl-tRNA(Gln) amidotransferase subunit C